MFEKDVGEGGQKKTHSCELFKWKYWFRLETDFHLKLFY